MIAIHNNSNNVLLHNYKRSTSAVSIALPFETSPSFRDQNVPQYYVVEAVRNVMAHGDAWEGK